MDTENKVQNTLSSIDIVSFLGNIKGVDNVGESYKRRNPENRYRHAVTTAYPFSFKGTDYELLLHEAEGTDMFHSFFNIKTKKGKEPYIPSHCSNPFFIGEGCILTDSIFMDMIRELEHDNERILRFYDRYMVPVDRLEEFMEDFLHAVQDHWLEDQDSDDVERYGSVFWSDRNSMVGPYLLDVLESVMDRFLPLKCEWENSIKHKKLKTDYEKIGCALARYVVNMNDYSRYAAVQDGKHGTISMRGGIPDIMVTYGKDGVVILSGDIHRHSDGSRNTIKLEIDTAHRKKDGKYSLVFRCGTNVNRRGVIHNITINTNQLQIVLAGFHRYSELASMFLEYASFGHYAGKPMFNLNGLLALGATAGKEPAWRDADVFWKIYGDEVEKQYSSNVFKELRSMLSETEMNSLVLKFSARRNEAYVLMLDGREVPLVDIDWLDYKKAENELRTRIS